MSKRPQFEDDPTIHKLLNYQPGAFQTDKEKKKDKKDAPGANYETSTPASTDIELYRHLCWISRDERNANLSRFIAERGLEVGAAGLEGFFAMSDEDVVEDLEELTPGAGNAWARFFVADSSAPKGAAYACTTGSLLENKESVAQVLKPPFVVDEARSGTDWLMVAALGGSEEGTGCGRGSTFKVAPGQEGSENQGDDLFFVSGNDANLAAGDKVGATEFVRGYELGDEDREDSVAAWRSALDYANAQSTPLYRIFQGRLEEPEEATVVDAFETKLRLGPVKAFTGTGSQQLEVRLRDVGDDGQRRKANAAEAIRLVPHGVLLPRPLRACWTDSGRGCIRKCEENHSKQV